MAKTDARNKALVRQWQDALDAMSKRDAAFQRVVAERQEVEHMLRRADGTSQSLEAENVDLRTAVAKLEVAVAQKRTALDVAASSGAEQAQTAAALAKEVANLRVVQAQTEREVAQTQAEAERSSRRAATALLRLNATTGRAKAAEAAVRETRALAAAEAAAWDRQSERLTAAVEAAEHAREADVVRVDAENIRLRLTNMAAEERAQALASEASAEKYRARAVARDYDELWGKWSAVSERALRQEYQINRLNDALEATRKAAMDGTAEGRATAAHAIHKLEEQLGDAQRERRRLEQTWLRSQRSLLRAHTQTLVEAERADAADAELAVAHLVHARLSTNREAAEEDARAAATDLDLLRLRLKRAEATAVAAEDRAVEMEAKLITARAETATVREELSAQRRAFELEMARSRTTHSGRRAQVCCR